ncbi:acyltransferase [Pedobacter sp. D749]|uniref:acyltransferase n=1 Tax=Pedobacter sp. D749 TaxID=2856523 RepID=UPI001C5638F5|nr:acyltransferase [Pedobacter sp. D749]QXU41697.1 acyltransferase [Pedobacter sp. D749]
MAGFSYLFKNRAVFPFASYAHIKAWAKRFQTLPELIRRNRRRSRLVKKGACIDERAEIGQVKAGGNKKNLKIGAYTFIGQVEFALHDQIVIGENVCVNDGVLFLTASHDLKDPEWKHVKSPIIIEDYAWICTNSIILPGVRIGRGAVVGAGAVVSKNVGDYEIVAGNPAQVLTKKRTEKLEYNPCSFLAANRAWLVG